MTATAAATGVDGGRGRRLLWALSTATFLIFFQAFMVAPLIPRLSDDLGVPPQRIGLIVPPTWSPTASRRSSTAPAPTAEADAG